MLSDFAYTFRTGMPFPQAVDAISREAAARGFRVLYVHDIQRTFLEKGLEREPYQIIEICNVRTAKKALDADPNVGLMMPCKIVVFGQHNATVVSLLRPSLLSSYFPEAGLQSLASEVEADLVQIADVARHGEAS